MGAKYPLPRIDHDNAAEQWAIRNLAFYVASPSLFVHNSHMGIYDVVKRAGIEAVQALLADQARTVAILDEWTLTGTWRLRGITVAEPRDFPAEMRHRLDGALLLRHYATLEGECAAHLPLLALAFLPDGYILTVNEPYSGDYFNKFNGVRSTK